MQAPIPPPIAECEHCGDETVLTWTTVPTPAQIRLAMCVHCGNRLNEHADDIRADGPRPIGAAFARCAATMVLSLYDAANAVGRICRACDATSQYGSARFRPLPLPSEFIPPVVRRRCRTIRLSTAVFDAHRDADELFDSHVDAPCRWLSWRRSRPIPAMSWRSFAACAQAADEAQAVDGLAAAADQMGTDAAAFVSFSQRRPVARVVSLSAGLRPGLVSGIRAARLVHQRPMAAVFPDPLRACAGRRHRTRFRAAARRRGTGCAVRLPFRVDRASPIKRRAYANWRAVPGFFCARLLSTTKATCR